MVCVAAIATGSATYAWFINNTKVTAESVNMTATTANTLLISPVAVEANSNGFSTSRTWGTTAKMTYTGLTAIKPVSTVLAATTGSNVDGLDFFTDSGWASETNTSENTQQTTNTKGVGDGSYNASEFTVKDVASYYYKGTFEIKASQAGSLYLDSDTAIKMMKQITNDNNTTFADATESNNISKDMIKSMRLALVVTDTSSTASKQNENINSTNGVYVYQWDDTAITGNSYNTTLTSLNNNQAVDGVTHGIASATPTDNSSTANIVKAFSETTTIKNLTSESGNNASKIKKLATVTAPKNSTTLATVDSGSEADLLYTFKKADDTVRITAYIWMEGCDYDCNNSVVNNIQGHTVNCQLGFALAAPTTETNSGSDSSN